ncbi:MAG TPA: spore germination protein [Bacillales bacterium]|nr:spore germination protein [Bacillales bacterium]
MPAIVGPIKIDNNSGVIEFGDTLEIDPTSTSKSYSGAGSFSTGNFHWIYSGFSQTIVPDPDLKDSNNISFG